MGFFKGNWANIFRVIPNYAIKFPLNFALESSETPDYFFELAHSLPHRPQLLSKPQNLLPKRLHPALLVVGLSVSVVCWSLKPCE